MARAAIHPGEHLAEELKELPMSAADLARQLKAAGIVSGLRRPDVSGGDARGAPWHVDSEARNEIMGLFST